MRVGEEVELRWIWLVLVQDDGAIDWASGVYALKERVGGLGAGD